MPPLLLPNNRPRHGMPGGRCSSYMNAPPLTAPESLPLAQRPYIQLLRLPGRSVTVNPINGPGALTSQMSALISVFAWPDLPRVEAPGNSRPS